MANACNTRGIHHVKVVAHSLTKLREIFTSRFLFLETFQSTNNNDIVVQRGTVHFLLQQIQSNPNGENPSEGVVDIAINSSCVDKLAADVVREGGRLILEPSNEEDEHGVVRKATVTSCIPTVVHTLVDTSRYHGSFLPGFQTVRHDCRTSSLPASIDRLHLDHVTLACDEGESESIINWYERCFGMRRFLVSSAETDDGFIVEHGSTGMRLKALNYWRCMESGVQTTNSPGKEFKIVVAEPLSHSGPNQITTFLRENEGPGVQHIGLLTDDILSVANTMKSVGLEFMRPPEMYYEEVNDLQMKTKRKNNFRILDLNLLKEACVLIDVEEDKSSEKSDTDALEADNDRSNETILYQVFTKPLFSRDTFFMELIQRNGARGFGAANIKALWKAVDLYMASKKDDASRG